MHHYLQLKDGVRGPSSLFRAQRELRTRREREREREKQEIWAIRQSCLRFCSGVCNGSSIFCENENEAKALNKLVRDEREGEEELS